MWNEQNNLLQQKVSGYGIHPNQKQFNYYNYHEHFLHTLYSTQFMYTQLPVTTGKTIKLKLQEVNYSEFVSNIYLSCIQDHVHKFNGLFVIVRPSSFPAKKSPRQGGQSYPDPVRPIKPLKKELSIIHSTGSIRSGEVGTIEFRYLEHMLLVRSTVEISHLKKDAIRHDPTRTLGIGRLMAQAGERFFRQRLIRGSNPAYRTRGFSPFWKSQIAGIMTCDGKRR